MRQAQRLYFIEGHTGHIQRAFKYGIRLNRLVAGFPAFHLSQPPIVEEEVRLAGDERNSREFRLGERGLPVVDVHVELPTLAADQKRKIGRRIGAGRVQRVHDVVQATGNAPPELPFERSELVVRVQFRQVGRAEGERDLGIQPLADSPRQILDQAVVFTLRGGVVRVQIQFRLSGREFLKVMVQIADHRVHSLALRQGHSFGYHVSTMTVTRIVRDAENVHFVQI